MSAVHLTRIDPAKNMARFYELDVQPNLFGEWCFIREWGRIGSPGRVKELPCSTETDALRLLMRRRQAKGKRRYQLGVAPPRARAERTSSTLKV